MRRLALATVCALAALPGTAIATPDTWRAGPTLSVARVAPGMAALHDGRVLVLGGEAVGGPTPTVEAYSPATNAFATAASMTVPRTSPLAATLSDGRVLVAGDAGGDRTGDVYDPATDSWTPTANDMRAARASGAFGPVATGTALPGGGALLAGAVDPARARPTAAVDRYDPSDNAFHAATDMSEPRALAGAAPLPGGKVLVVGGSDGTRVLASGEVYDPRADAWTPVANELATPHADPGVAPLPDGKVLIFGGAVDNSIAAPHSTPRSTIRPPTASRRPVPSCAT